MKVFAAVFVLVCLSALPLWAENAALGRKIFTGEAKALSSDALVRTLARQACHDCHGRDGLGGVEGDVPPIDWRLLSRQTNGRPAYDRDAFLRVVREGVDAAGRDLSRLMPRYDLSPSEGEALFAYLQEIAEDQRRGVTPRDIRIGVPVLAAGEGKASVLERGIEAGLWEALGGQQVYGRSVEIVSLNGPDPALAADTLAVLSPRASDAKAYVQAGIPVLFPLGTLEGDEDASILRGSTPDRRTMRRALARELIARGATHVTLEPGDDPQAEPLALELRLQDPSFADRTVLGAAKAKDTQGELVLLGNAALPEAGWNGRIWLPWARLRAGDLPKGAKGPIIVMINTPWIVTRAIETKTHPVWVHGYRSGVVLGEALKSAGRDVTRAGLIKALDDSVLKDLGLDYQSNRLSGTNRVDFIETTGD